MAYGPGAVMVRFARGTVFSSSDATGSYSYGRQTQMMHCNMGRFAEALLPAINAVDPEGVEEAKTIVDGIPDRFRSAWLARMRGKLGIAGAFDGEGDLI